MQSDASRCPGGRTQADQVERDAQALLAVYLRALSGVEGRVSPAQLRVLTLLRDHGPRNLGELADGLGVRPSSATRLCDRLTAAGLLLREVAPHSRREVVLSLSRPGRDLLAELEDCRREQIAAVLTVLSPADREGLLRGLAAFAAATAGAAVPDERSAPPRA